MMKKQVFFLLFSISAILLISFSPPRIELIPDEDARKVDILIDGKLFTSYIWPEEIKKPVLWPVISSGGNEITRQFPLKVKAGERADHPHHIGIWLNYGNVNGIDFWNNSENIKPEVADEYGTIYHQEIIKAKSGEKKGILITSAVWKDHSGNSLLNEKSEFQFRDEDGIRMIDRKTTLTAIVDKVDFTDNKEGMFAIRVARELELPEDKSVKLTDSHGKVTEVSAPDNSLVSGDYLSSEGITGAEVWGTRAKWMKLAGELNGEKLAIVIFDHPDNVGYPTHWHARTYGLFSANTLGQKALTDGKMELNFSLVKGESVTFTYRLAIFPEDPTVEKIEKIAGSFQK